MEQVRRLQNCFYVLLIYLGPTALAFRGDSTSTNGHRRLNPGPAWTVDGLVPQSIGVSNGRGGLIGSGTNAPLYSSLFSSATLNPAEDIEKHEGRLAKALDFDRTQRVFNFVDLTISPPKAIHAKRKYAEVEDSKTVWNGSEWVIKGAPPSEQQRTPQFQ